MAERPSDEQLARAQLMRQALHDAKLKQADVANAMNKQPSTLTKWLQGKQRPSDEDLAHFAAIVGRPVAYFSGGPPEDVEVRLMRLLEKLGRRAMEGLNMPEALLAEKLPPERLTAEALAILQPVADEFRQRIRRISGRDWHLLSAGEQAAVLQEFAAMLVRGEDRPDTGRRGGSSPGTTPGRPRLIH